MTTSQHTRTTMKLLQLNVWQSRLDRQILSFLEQEQPDLLCLQEICSSQINMPFFPGLRGLEAIQEAFPDYHCYFSPCFEAPMLGEQCYFGNAILSRFPLTEKETIFTNGEYQSTTMPTSATTNIRNVQRVTVQSDQGDFCLVNHHGYWVPNEMGNEISIEKMQKVADVLEQSSRPLIFSGDLNVVAKSPAMQPIHRLLRDLTQEHAVKTTLSGFGKVPNVPCDHICISEGIEEQHFSVSDTLLSDHKALLLEYDLA